MATTQQEVKQMKKEIKELKSLLEDQSESLIEEGKARATAKGAELKLVAQEAGKSVREFLDDSKGSLTTARDNTEARIKERPFASAAIAFAGGVLLTSLLSRK